jgi:hypothetical protein
MFVVWAVGAFAPGAALAHHSRANYDMSKEIVVEGTVANLAWSNPHNSMTLETERRERASGTSALISRE